MLKVDRYYLDQMKERVKSKFNSTIINLDGLSSIILKLALYFYNCDNFCIHMLAQPVTLSPTKFRAKKKKKKNCKELSSSIFFLSRMRDD